VGSSSSSSLTLRSLLKSAATRAGLAPVDGRVSGLTAPAQALLVATAAAQDGVVLVVATNADVERAVADVRFFLAALEGLTETDATRAVLPCPALEVDPYRGLSPHFEVASARARALHALATGVARVVVVSAAGLLPRMSAPDRLVATGLELVAGGELSPTALGDLLAEAGFVREDPVDARGEFCVRGGVVDVFPPGEPSPLRLEFVGDTIESIRRYDSSTQRSIEPTDRATVVPVRELFESTDGVGLDAFDRSATFLDFALRAGRCRFLVAESDEVATRAAQLVEQLGAGFADALARGERVPPPEDLIVTWEEAEGWLAHATRLELLAIDDTPEPPSMRSARSGPGEARLPAEVSEKVGAPSSESGVPTSQFRVSGPEFRHVSCQPAVEFRGRVADWVAEIGRLRAAGDTVVFVAATPGRAERTIGLLADAEVRAVSLDRAEDTLGASVLVAIGQLSRGFRLPDAGLQLFAETDVFDEERRVHERRRSVARTFLSDFRDLKTGDHVVHVDHGIGVFVGLKRLAVGRDTQEFVELRYAGDDKLFVPVERLDLVQKYTGGAHPTLDRLGGTTWERVKTRVRKAMRDMAEELLKLYAARRAAGGHAFSADTHWQQEFEDAFEYELTPDQVAAIQDIKRDMETPFPMDRLLCGDVGYGKTEVAMRAAFKTVLDGKQVAFLAPTTVLAFQHLKTLHERFAGFPVQIDMISRFRSKAEQRQTLTDLAAGKVDIIVGTHRLLSKDVAFRDLGLLIVDEEQRFGVAHKERIKQLKKRVDVLTMTATPIPRTLNMSLAGIRDMSVIETPPRDRLAIQTSVVKFDTPVITRAIRNELERNGQIYFVHNRVESIYSLGSLLQRVVPEARVAVAHGQMKESALERAMVDFVAHRYDVLLATTIIENGLDIPNANTLIVNRADRYGLAQLYQLRGRVGRSDRRAYAYLLIPPEESLSPVARKRLAAIREFSDLGSGFRVAALDLEIRGAGNLLGGEQSGHIDAVGFDTYMKLLDQAVKELRGEEIEDERTATVNLHVDVRIDEGYVPDMNQRLGIYRRMAAIRQEADLDRILAEVRDRYGPPPVSIRNLAEYARIRTRAGRLGLESVDREGQTVVLKFRGDAPIDPLKLIRVVGARPDLTLIPPGTLRLALGRAEGGSRPGPAGAGRGRGGRRGAPDQMSWWTTRARTGQVTGGFSREEILRPPKEDRTAVDAVLTELGGLLAELSLSARID